MFFLSFSLFLFFSVFCNFAVNNILKRSLISHLIRRTPAVPGFAAALSSSLLSSRSFLIFQPWNWPTEKKSGHPHSAGYERFPGARGHTTHLECARFRRCTHAYGSPVHSPCTHVADKYVWERAHRDYPLLPRFLPRIRGRGKREGCAILPSFAVSHAKFRARISMVRAHIVGVSIIPYYGLRDATCIGCAFHTLTKSRIAARQRDVRII